MKFASGLSVRLDNSQYIGPDVTINKTTGAFEVASTEPDVAMIALQDTNADDIIRIGRNFFSAAYIMVNYDAGEFTIWAANPTASEDLVAVDSTGAEVDSFCSTSNKTATVTAGGSNPSKTDGSSSSTTSASSSANSSLSVPAITGGVIGGVAGIVALGLAAWLLFRRRRKANKDPRQFELDINHPQNPGPEVALHRFSKFEVPGSQPGTVHELAPSPRLFHELPSRGHEMGHANWRCDPSKYESPGGSVVYEMQ